MTSPQTTALVRLARELDRQRDVAQLLVAAVEVLDRKVEGILRKLERRDG
jgi:hypothetical protein